MKKIFYRLVFFPGFFAMGLFSNSFAQENITPLTLEAAMDMSENYAFSARIATQMQAIDQGREDEQFRSMFPNISLSGSYLEYSTDVNKAVGTPTGQFLGFPPKTTSSAGLTLTQPLVGLIQIYLSLQSASAQTLASLHKKEQSRADARLLGANSFINAVKSIQLLNVAQSSVKVAQTQLRDGVAQFNAGKLTNADVLKFKLNLENAETNLIQAQTTAKITLVTLAETTGIKNISLIVLPKNYVSPWAKKKPKDQHLDSLITKALESRNDFKSAKYSSMSAKYAKNARQSSYLPSVNFVTNYSRNFQAGDINVPANPFTPALSLSKSNVQDTMYYGVQFSWNLLDWGVRQAQISQSIASESSAQIQVEQLESQIKLDVTNNYLKLNDAYQTLDSAKISVDYTKDVFNQMQAQFNNGQATTTDVLSASNEQTSAQAKLANAIGDLDLTWLNLQKSVGDRLTTQDNN